MTADWTTTTQTIGIGGYPAAGILGETPELVGYRRDRGYPWRPFDAMPAKFIPGASGIGKVVGDDWSWWARRVAARVAARIRTELADLARAEDAEQIIYKTAEDEQWKPAHDGNTIHLHTALNDAGRPQTVELPDRLQGHAASWEVFKANYKVRFGAIERTGYAPDFGVGAAGTIDRLIAYTPLDSDTEQLAVCDLKTKAQPLSKVQVSIEHLIQVVALAQSRYLAIEEQRVLIDLPPIPTTVIVYLCRDGYRAQWIDPHQDDLLVLTRACIAARAGKDRLGSGAFGTPDVHQTRNTHGPKLVPVPNGQEESNDDSAA